MSNTKRTRREAPQSLKAWRETHGFSTREAARFIGVSQSYYSKVERHDQAPRPTMMKRFTKTTGVPVEELMGIAG